MKFKILLYLLFWGFVTSIHAQDIDFNNTVPAALHSCADIEQFTVEFTNNTGANITNVTVQVDLPTGISYQSNLFESSSYNVQELDVSNPSSILFSANDLADKETINFTFDAIAGFDAISFQQAGNVFRNTVTVNYNGGASETTQTNAYNVFVSALSITTVDDLVQEAAPGEIFTRSITIFNGGFGKVSSFTLKDINDGGLLLMAADVGTIDATRTEIFIDANIISQVGNGDDWLDQNESIVITETLQMRDCADSDSEIYAFWGCDGQTEISNKRFPKATATLLTPNLEITPIVEFEPCIVTYPDLQQLSITNNGLGAAENIILDVYQYAGSQSYKDIFSKIDVDNITYTIDGGSPISLTPDETFDTDNTGPYACLGSTAKGRFLASLPRIEAGQTLVLTWESLTCATDYCGRVDLVGWRYQVDYEDDCLGNDYSDRGVGQEHRYKDVDMFVENPVDILDGETALFTYVLSSVDFNLQNYDQSYLELIINVPAGLSWSGNNEDLKFIDGVTEWVPASINFNNSTRTLTARYDFPVPFNLTRSEFQMKLTGNCGGGVSTGSQDVGMQLFYIMNADCDNPYRVRMTCTDDLSTYLHCPGTCNWGMRFDEFNIARTSLGLPDNDLNGLPDAGGSLDMDFIKTNRVMVGDTFETKFVGEVRGASWYQWNWGYANSNLPNGKYLELIGASIEVYDASTGNTLTCDNVAFRSFLDNNNGILTANFDFSVATLVANGCTDFNGFGFRLGDQVTLKPRYKVIDNIGPNIEQITITNDFYLGTVENPAPNQRYQCDTWYGNVTMIGYEFTTTRRNNFNVQACTRTIQQSYNLQIGDYSRDDLFPREYRNWGNLNEVTVELPDGYTVDVMYLRQDRIRYTNSVVRETQNPIVPTSINGNNYSFDITQYYNSGNGNINYGDEGFTATVLMRVRPDCGMVQETFFPIEWSGNFTENEFLGGGTTANYTEQDRIRYHRAKLGVSTNIQTQDGIAQTVSWNVTVNNTSTRTHAFKTWLYLYSPSDDIEIVEVVENATGTVLPKIGEFYRLGQINRNASEGYTVSARYNRCVVDELVIRSGYSCTDYPMDFSEVECDYHNSNYSVYVSPLPSEMQAKVERIADTDETCGATVGTALEVLSAKIGHIKDIVVTVEVPNTNSILVDVNTSQLAYPINAGFSDITEPTKNGNIYTYEINDFNTTIADEGLVGVSDIDANKLQLYFDLTLQANYTVGEKVVIRVDAKRTCGDDLPTMVFNYDPFALFTKFRNIGLDVDEDNRGMAWGDYDGDDYPDLFVTNYSVDEPNSLYHNNGDGTFSKVTTGAIATDLASSIASSWADYDNDGDLDLYVTNNIGFRNFLYRNNGDGTFVSVQNDPVVNYLGYSHGVAWGDYDNDGFLDLFVTDYFSSKFNKLYHNNGDGTFTENTTSPVTLDAGSSTAATWVDYDEDGDQDLFVTNYNNENNALYDNRGNGNFTKITTGAIVNDGGQSTGASWGDINNDGNIDLFVANAGNQNNFLYLNNGNGSFTKVTTGNIVNDGGHSHGSAFADYDNDGDLDLTVSNDSDSNNFLYANNGDGTFTSIDNEVTTNAGNSAGVAWADYDLDGDLDIFTVNHSNSENFFFNNDRGSCNQDACLILVGTNSNYSALGAEVSVKANIFGKDVWQTRVIQSQTGGGLGGQNDLTQHFGLGDAAIIDSIKIEWPSGYIQYLENQDPTTCLTIVEEDGSIIFGKAFYDTNKNCVYDADEPVIPNTQLLIQPINKYAMTDENGDYSINLPAGNYMITAMSQTNWEIECPTAESGIVVQVGDPGSRYGGNDFPFQASSACAALPDLAINLATTALRVGSQSLYAINVSNNGTEIAKEVSVSVDFGPDIQPLESSIPWTSASGSSYNWDIGSLAIGQAITIYVEDSILMSAIIGDSVTVAGRVQSLGGGECNEADNTFADRNIFVGAIDPNDILVNPEGRIRKEQVLTYKIRFQNVGNAEVRTVVLRDELPSSLDIESLVLGGASHPYKFRIEDENILVWEFENINLPDSIANEVESHGFVTFRITPKQDVENGTTIQNKAAIYFDNFSPIITNTVANIVYDKVNGDRGTLMIFPNPMTDLTTIQIIPKDVINGKPVDIQSIYVYDYVGRLIIQERQIDDLQHRLENIGLTNGYYLVKAIGDDGNEYLGKLLIQDTY